MTDWSQQMRDRSVVETQYSTTDRLERRISIWSPGSDGIDPTALLRDSIVELHPRHAVEIGCGSGKRLARLAVRHRVALLLLLAYLATRALVLFLQKS